MGSKLTVVGLDAADAGAVTRLRTWLVKVEDWRNGSDPAPWGFVVKAADVPGAVQAAKGRLARRTTDRIVSVTDVTGTDWQGRYGSEPEGC